MQPNSLLTTGLKQTITQLGLVNTGKLRDSIIVWIAINSDVILIDVASEDYIKYLIEPYNIVDAWTNQDQFGTAISLVLAPWLEDKIVKEFGKPFIWNPKITITFNGE